MVHSIKWTGVLVSNREIFCSKSQMSSFNLLIKGFIGWPKAMLALDIKANLVSSFPGLYSVSHHQRQWLLLISRPTWFHPSLVYTVCHQRQWLLLISRPTWFHPYLVYTVYHICYFSIKWSRLISLLTLWYNHYYQVDIFEVCKRLEGNIW